MLFDTDVLIWCFRGNAKAARLVELARSRSLSVVSYLELLQGARDRSDLRNIQSFLSEFEFGTAALSEAIGHRAAVYMEEYALSVGLCVADALIAATAVENAETLATGNTKHFSVVGDLSILEFRP